MSTHKKSLPFQRCGANLACLSAATTLVHLPQGSTYFCDYHAGVFGAQAAVLEKSQRTCGYLGDGKQPCGQSATSQVSYGEHEGGTVYFCDYHIGLILTFIITELEKKQS